MSYLFAFAHMQQWQPYLAPAALILLGLYLFARRGLNPAIAKNQVFLLVIIAYLVFNIALHIRPGFAPAALVDLVATDGRLLYLLVFSLMFSAIRLQAEDLRALFKAGIITGAAICAISFASFLTQPFSAQQFDFGSIQTATGRWIVGFLETKNPFAGSIGAVFLLALGAMFSSPRFRVFGLGRVVSLLVVILLFAALVASRSTGYFFGVIAALAYIVFFERSFTMSERVRAYMKYALGVVAIIAAAAFFTLYSDRIGDLLAGQDVNMQRRVAIFSRTLQLIAQSPLLGLGPGAVQAYQLETHTIVPGLVAVRESAVFLDEFYWIGALPVGQHAHNIILQLTSDYGLIGVGLIFVFFLRAVFLRKGYAGADRPVIAIDFHARVQLVYLVSAVMVAGYSISSPSTAWIFYAALGWLCQPPRPEKA